MKDNARYYPLNGRIATYAGRCDLEAMVDGKRYVVDFKTGTKPKKEPYYEWRLQTAAYRFALPETEGTEGNAVLHLDKLTGLPTWYDFSEAYQQDFTAFQHLTAFYHIANREKFNPEIEVPSVTTICSLLDKSPQLMWWAVDMMGSYILLNYKHGMSEVGLTDLVDQAKRNYRKVAKEAADIGSQVHACIEGYLRTGIEPKIDDERILAGFVAFLEWRDTVRLEVIAQEVVVYG